MYPFFRPYLPGAVKIYHTVDLMTAFHSSAPPSACPGREELGLFLDLIKIFPGIRWLLRFSFTFIVLNDTLSDIITFDVSLSHALPRFAILP